MRADHITDEHLVKAITRRLGGGLLKAHFDWRGEVDCVSYKVSYWGADYMSDVYGEPHGVWNYYLVIPSIAFNDGTFDRDLWLPVARMFDCSSGEQTPCYNEESSGLADLDWHGGITHFSKHTAADSTHRRIEVGCDYAHAFDRDRHYDYEFADVKRDAENTARKFRQRFPTMLWRSAYSGKWFPREEIVETDNGYLISKAEHDKRLADAALAAAKASA